MKEIQHFLVKNQKCILLIMNLFSLEIVKKVNYQRIQKRKSFIQEMRHHLDIKIIISNIWYHLLNKLCQQIQKRNSVKKVLFMILFLNLDKQRKLKYFVKKKIKTNVSSVIKSQIQLCRQWQLCIITSITKGKFRFFFQKIKLEFFLLFNELFNFEINYISFCKIILLMISIISKYLSD
ncbi:unnamed protein product [Paramecium primaurelia]|uniref:Transmembrane protein n=1 Tax=Paramecium primaurelia TaxID=5886 RepID=A0A8S1MLB8_PARPR|nr:unnamed protein product [Paramecium primaurelia]